MSSRLPKTESPEKSGDPAKVHQRVLALVLAGWFALGLAATSIAPKRAAIESIRTISPAADRPAGNPALTTSVDGKVWMSWLESTTAEVTSLRVASFDPAGNTWGPARTVVARPGWTANYFDAPQLVATGGRLVAAWTVALGDDEFPRGYWSESKDDGLTWSEPALLTAESKNVDYVSLVALANGELLAVWIDGRNRPDESAPAQLYSRIMGGTGPDFLVDARVCDCCRSSLVSLPDGGAALAYRGRSHAEVRDIQTARFENGRWRDTGLVAKDDWTITGCPVNGPRLASNALCGDVAWFTAAGSRPRVQLAMAAEPGQRASPVVLDLGEAAGHVDVVVLADNRRVVTWLEAGSQPGIYLRLTDATGPIGAAVRVAELPDGAQARTFPRIAVADPAGSAAVLLAYAKPGAVATVETLQVRLPRGWAAPGPGFFP